MFCGICQKELIDCVCPDKAERLDRISKVGNVAVKWCRRCCQHYAACKCPMPDFTVMVNGKDIGPGPHRMLDGSFVFIDPHVR